MSEIKKPLETGLREARLDIAPKKFQEMNARSEHGGENENKY